MTEMATYSGAFSDAQVPWSTLKWNSVYRNVRRLQARLVKATQAKRWGKVKALQRLLPRSCSAKVLAIRRVTAHTGKNTPGADGAVWNTPEKQSQALNELKHQGYRPSPRKRVSRPQADGRQRPLAIPTMLDRAMQTLSLQALDPIAACQADPNSSGFRSARSTADARAQCHIVLRNRGGAAWIVEGDRRSCFDTISHEW
jgi:RNA-directed DNA polymerase